MTTFPEDRDLPQRDIFSSIHEVLSVAERQSKGKVFDSLADTFRQSISSLLDIHLASIAEIIDQHLSSSHTAADSSRQGSSLLCSTYRKATLMAPRRFAYAKSTKYVMPRCGSALIDRGGDPQAALSLVRPAPFYANSRRACKQRRQLTGRHLGGPAQARSRCGNAYMNMLRTFSSDFRG